MILDTTKHAQNERGRIRQVALGRVVPPNQVPARVSGRTPGAAPRRGQGREDRRRHDHGDHNTARYNIL